MSEIKKDYKDKDLCLPKKITSHEPTAIKRDRKLKKVSVKRRIIRGPFCEALI